MCLNHASALPRSSQGEKSSFLIIPTWNCPGEEEEEGCIRATGPTRRGAKDLCFSSIILFLGRAGQSCRELCFPCIALPDMGAQLSLHPLGARGTPRTKHETVGEAIPWEKGE